jgi:hypothetical protein
MNTQYDKFNQEADEMWGKYNTMQTSLTTVADPKRIESLNTQMKDIQTRIDAKYAERDTFYTQIQAMDQELNNLRQEAYISDLKDEADFRQLFWTRMNQEKSRETAQQAEFQANSDDWHISAARLTFWDSKLAEQKEYYDSAVALYNEEFTRRQKQKAEEQFFADMDRKQKEVDKKWANVTV